MTQRILIDAVHPEEVRVVMAQDNRLEEFDFETAVKKQIKGNIYLGKITRVEPSLQAAFVEYGGLRQGFLPFAEVHYDYYQIPVEDREKIAELLEKERDRTSREPRHASQDASSQDDSSQDAASGEESNGAAAGSAAAGSGEADGENRTAESPEDNEPTNKTVSARTPRDKDEATLIVDPAEVEKADKPKRTRKPAAAVRRPRKSTKTKEAGAETKTSDAEIPMESAVEKPVRTRRAAAAVAAEGEGEGKIEIDEAARRKAEELERAFAEDFGLVQPASESASTEAAPVADAAEQGGRGGEDARGSRHGRRRGRGRDRGGRWGEDRGHGGTSEDKGRVRNAEGGSDDDLSEDKHHEHEEIGGGDDAEEMRSQRSQIFRNYKIQEVLKRNQIVLVQVIKEERGSKGASLTTYISLAGRYCVLMPNTDRGGGVSRRITDIKVRKQLKALMAGMDLPKGASAIIRTAGIERAPEEIRQDFNYLLQSWEEIRQKAVKSVAPALVYEEGNLIKRCLRDMFRDNVDEVVVQGQDGYDMAKVFLEATTTENHHRLKQYKGAVPIFRHYGIDAQLDELYDNEARLPSGGAIVITPTEALVSIDVNSGRSTRERSIEDTALKTNLEAAEEIARQLRLRDLAGLVVIDFIDMRELRNKRAVESTLKRALKTDRARIQVGRISPFGLLEMSRQRLRSSIVEASTVTCPSCGGAGVVRSDESTAVKLLRVIEGDAAKDQTTEVALRASIQAAFYLLNHKRDEITSIEKTYNVKVLIDHDHSLVGAEYALDRQRPLRNKRRRGEFERDRGDSRGDTKEREARPERSGEPESGGENRGGESRSNERGGEAPRQERTPRNRDRDPRRAGGRHERGDRQGGRPDWKNRQDRTPRPETQAATEEPIPAAAMAVPVEAGSAADNWEDDSLPQPERNQDVMPTASQRGGQRDRGDRNRGKRRGGGRNQQGGGYRGQGDRPQGQRVPQGEHPAARAGGEGGDFPSDSPANDVAHTHTHRPENSGEGDDANKDSSRLRGLWKKITQ